MWQGRARPSRVNHSRPWGVQGGGYGGGFAAIYPTSAAFFRSFSLRSAAISHPELDIILRQVPRVIAGVEGFNRSAAKSTSFKGTVISGKGWSPRRPNIAFVQISSAWASL